MHGLQVNSFSFLITLFLSILILIFTFFYFSPPLILICLGGLVLYNYFFTYRREGEKVKELAEKTNTDRLTGLKTMGCFCAELEKAFENGNKPGVAALELQGLIKWRNFLGAKHEFDLMSKVGDFFSENVPAKNLVARWGPDNFFILFPEKSIDKMVDSITLLQQELQNNKFEVEGNSIELETAVAFALAPDDGQNPEELLTNIQQNLQRISRTGNKISITKKFSSEVELPEQTDFLTQENSLDKISKKSTQLYLLMQEKEVEIIKQDIAEEKPFSIQQTGAEECFEFYYILDGEVKNLYSGEVFKGGSFITINAPGEPIYLKTLTPVSFLYITNAPIFKQQSSEMSQYVQLVDEMEGKEHPIESHGKRIEKMALELGKAMDLEGENLFALIFAAYLHDVGKVKIPGSILQKKGPLNKDEWETIKKHPIWGKDLVQTHLEHQTKKKVGEIVYQHHENYDGSGYPEGLKGDEICIEAQILSLLDAYDAMTSDRPYQSALSSEEAIEEIKRNTGTQFSPKVVEKFIPLMEEMEGEKAEPAN